MMTGKDQRRKCGAQPGNLNAVKHGRHARLVPAEVARDMPHILSHDLEEEINMLRSATRRVFELADQSANLDQMIKFLGALGLASIRTARLLKAQQELGNGDNALSMIAEMFRKFKQESSQNG
jgi:hypothetical protein